MKITKEMYEGAYEVAKKVYQGSIGRNEGRFEIERLTGMSIGSAGDYITDFLAMVSGQKYTRTLNTNATKHYLENIKKDYGIDVFNKALDSVTEHVKYYNGLGHGNLDSIQSLVDEMKDK